MAGEAQITIVGRVGGDPTLTAVGQSGAQVVNFSVATTSRIKNKATQQWEDGDTTWYECSAWRDHAENIAANLRKGQQVIVLGRLKTRKYTTNAGQQGMALEVQVDDVGPAIPRFAPRGTTGGSSTSVSGTWGGYAQEQAAWATTAADDETPF